MKPMRRWIIHISHTDFPVSHANIFVFSSNSKITSCNNWLYEKNKETLSESRHSSRIINYSVTFLLFRSQIIAYFKYWSLSTSNIHPNVLVDNVQKYSIVWVFIIFGMSIRMYKTNSDKKGLNLSSSHKGNKLTFMAVASERNAIKISKYHLFLIRSTF